MNTLKTFIFILGFMVIHFEALAYNAGEKNCIDTQKGSLARVMGCTNQSPDPWNLIFKDLDAKASSTCKSRNYEGWEYAEECQYRLNEFCIVFYVRCKNIENIE